MSVVEVLVGGLVTWRLTLMLVKETGPLNVFSRLRAYLAQKQKRMGGMFDMISCMACASVWVGSVTSLWPAQGFFSWIWYTLAFSAITILIERFSASKS